LAQETGIVSAAMSIPEGVKTDYRNMLADVAGGHF
jgi:hypothetical protein